MSCAFGSGYTLNPTPRLSDIRVTLTQKHTHMESQTEISKHRQKHVETDRFILTDKPTLIEDNNIHPHRDKKKQKLLNRHIIYASMLFEFLFKKDKSYLNQQKYTSKITEDVEDSLDIYFNQTGVSRIIKVTTLLFVWLNFVDCC